MADLSSIRHALETARDRGFAEVSLRDGELKFDAVLSAPKVKASKPSATSQSDADEQSAGPKLFEIKSPLVGYFRAGNKPLAIGEKVTTGDVVAIISQLGIANDVESKASGEIVEICVEENQAVGFGQVIALVRED
ncbi:MAG: biotin/lipoyl-containing protein [Fimbriimonadaceae bacterium]